MAPGDATAAEAHFGAALELDPRDRYLRNALADHYLEQGQPAKAIASLAGDRDTDGALLRRALAAADLGHGESDELTRRLARRFESLSRRGDSVHLGEAARFELRLRGNAERALELALDNWRSQREARDALILLQAAFAAGRPADAGAVRSWIARTGIEDTRLKHVLASYAEAGR